LLMIMILSKQEQKILVRLFHSNDPDVCTGGLKWPPVTVPSKIIPYLFYWQSIQHNVVADSGPWPFNISNKDVYINGPVKFVIWSFSALKAEALLSAINLSIWHHLNPCDIRIISSHFSIIIELQLLASYLYS
jgi:hypothetical protein